MGNRAWWFIGLGAVLLLGASTSTTPAFNTYPTTWERYPGPATDDANGQPTPRGPRMVNHDTRWPNGRAFVRALRPMFERLGLSRDAATLLTAHAALETGSGSHVTNNNIGNVRAFASTTTPWHRTQSGRPWRAYPSLWEGARGLYGVITAPKYRDARRLLITANPRWYSALGTAGYLEGSGPNNYPTLAEMQRHQASYNGVLASVRRWLT